MSKTLSGNIMLNTNWFAFCALPVCVAPQQPVSKGNTASQIKETSVSQSGELL